MIGLTPTHIVVSRYICECGGDVAKLYLDYNNVHWTCVCCGKEAVCDPTKQPSFANIRKEIVE